jgi:methionyl aminopeptidase
MIKDYKDSFQQMKIAGSLAAETLDIVTPYVVPGVSTDKLDKICYEFIRDNKGYSAPLFYRGFPKSCCTSANHIICHGIPTDKFLKEGDVINIDVTAIVNNWHGDTSRMFFVGDVSVKSKNLISVTYKSMMKAISIVKDGIHLGDIGEIIQNYVEEKGFSVVKDFCGHGIGKTFHEQPNILHYGKKGEGKKIKTGMIFTIEPMVNEGNYQIKMLNDGWTAVTRDKTLSAQFEHTIGVTSNGFEIFTESKKNYSQPPYSI